MLQGPRCVVEDAASLVGLVPRPLRGGLLLPRGVPCGERCWRGMCRTAAHGARLAGDQGERQLRGDPLEPTLTHVQPVLAQSLRFVHSATQSLAGTCSLGGEVVPLGGGVASHPGGLALGAQPCQGRLGAL